jgi:pilus assembly protein FimV
MKYKFRLLCALLVATPGPVLALGLGDIRLSSGLNQPLAATIELVGARPEELGQLRATLAPREAFTRAGLDRPAFLSGLRFKVAKDASGRDVLEIRSADAISEPFITMLIELDWPRGRLIREYTVLLDPPVFESQPSAAAPLVAARTGTPASTAAGAVTRAPAASAPAAPAATGGGGEYRVVAKDTLSSIVARSGGGTGCRRR